MGGICGDDEEGDGGGDGGSNPLLSATTKPLGDPVEPKLTRLLVWVPKVEELFLDELTSLLDFVLNLLLFFAEHNCSCLL